MLEDCWDEGVANYTYGALEQRLRRGGPRAFPAHPERWVGPKILGHHRRAGNGRLHDHLCGCALQPERVADMRT